MQNRLCTIVSYKSATIAAQPITAQYVSWKRNGVRLLFSLTVSTYFPGFNCKKYVKWKSISLLYQEIKQGRGSEMKISGSATYKSVKGMFIPAYELVGFIPHV